MIVRVGVGEMGAPWNDKKKLRQLGQLPEYAAVFHTREE